MDIKKIELPELGYTPNNLKTLRNILGLSQEELAKLLGVQRPSVGRWELDINSPSYRQMPIQKWVEALKKVQNPENNS